LHPASAGTLQARQTASKTRRFLNVHLLAAPRYRWWLRQILASLFVIPWNHEISIAQKTTLCRQVGVNIAPFRNIFIFATVSPP
jgi:hypothetical protein